MPGNRVSRSASCYEDPSEQLLKAFQNKKIDKFKDLLSDPSNFTDNPELNCKSEWSGTLLHFACHVGEFEYVKLLLDYYYSSTHLRCIPNYFCNHQKRAPIHSILKSKEIQNEKKRIATLEALVSYKYIDVNVLDKGQNTALHWAVKLNYSNCVRVLLNKQSTDVNCQNNKGHTPLHIALLKKEDEINNENDEIIKMLIHHPNTDFDLEDEDKLTASSILEKYDDPELYNLIQQIRPRDKKENKKTLFQMWELLEDDKDEEFIKALTNKEYEGNLDVQKRPFMEYCAEYGKEKVLKELLNNGFSPNGSKPKQVIENAQQEDTPIMIAIKKGYVNIVNMLLSNDSDLTPVNGENVFHKAILGSTQEPDLPANNTLTNHNECLQILLKNSRSKSYLNCVNYKGNSPLHFAAIHNRKQMIEELLKAGAYIGGCNNAGKPALALVPTELLRSHLDECIIENKESPQHENYEINLKYNLLDPHNDVGNGDIEANNSKCPFNYETQALVYMSKMPEMSQLLKHPVITSFLYIKWNKIRYIYNSNLIFYIIFCILFTWNILNNYGGPKAKEIVPLAENITNITGHDINEDLVKTNYFFQEKHVHDAVWSGTVIFSTMLFFRELLQWIILHKIYWKQKENILEIGIIVFSILILFGQLGQEIGHQIAAFGILFTWGELVLLIGRHPNLATYIEMLNTVTKSFFKFLLWYSLLIIAFALSFYTLFSDNSDDDTFFDHPFISMFKVSVMLTGEFEATSVPFDKYPVSSHILFVLFVFLIAIVLFNLLNGLAISDTHSIKSDAELIVYKSQINMISMIEVLLHNSNFWEKISIKIKSLFCCLITSSTEYNFVNNNCCSNSLGYSVNIFPQMGEITIKPNKGNIIENEMTTANKKNSWFCNPLKSCTTMEMKTEIVTAAKEIIVNKKIKSETINLESRIKNIEDKIETILEILQRGKGDSFTDNNDDNNNN